MARYGNYLYQRNGHFCDRLRVPQPLEGVFGKSHLRESLDTADYGEARLRVLEKILALKRNFLRHRTMLDIRQIVAGSALILGDGLLTIDSAARECGLHIEEMLREVINRAVALRIEAAGCRVATYLLASCKPTTTAQYCPTTPL